MNRNKLIFAGIGLVVALVLIANAVGLFSFSGPPKVEPLPPEKASQMDEALKRSAKMAEEVKKKPGMIETGLPEGSTPPAPPK